MEKEEGLIFLRRREVEQRVGITRSPLYERVSEGAFPAPIRLKGSRSVRWLKSDVDAWMAAQVEETRARGNDATLAVQSSATPDAKKVVSGETRAAQHRRARAARTGS
jgi:prophage regulatory protein